MIYHGHICKMVKLRSGEITLQPIFVKTNNILNEIYLRFLKIQM